MAIENPVVEELPKRPGVLASLVRVGNVFNTEHNFEQLLETIIEETIRLLSADRASLFLLDEERSEIWSKIATGLNKGEEIRLKKSEGIVGHAISTGKTINVPDVYADPRFNRDVDQATGYETRTILCFPLITFEGKTIGAFQVLNKKDGAFNAEDEQILSVLASQASIAIENVRLLHETTKRQENLSTENSHLKKQLKGKYAYPTILGDSMQILAVTRAIDKVSTTDANVLITGESGTGKELIARAVHSKSSRGNMLFIPLNCASLPESLLESELFGIEKGVATGVAKRSGYLELAHQGTLFLDEVSEMSLGMQVKLLRAMQDRTFLRVGGSREIQVDVRVISATNRELKQSIRDGQFRDDLYYRLNVFPIHVPALRERQGDIEILSRYILGNVVEKMNLSGKRFSAGSLEAMKQYPWPGNVRELENVIERAVILSDGPEVEMELILADLLRSELHGKSTSGVFGEAGGGQFTPLALSAEGLDLKQAVGALEVKFITAALEQTHGNQLRAARKLGISREGLRKKMARYDLRLSPEEAK